jgi:hypothetical protein
MALRRIGGILAVIAAVGLLALSLRGPVAAVLEEPLLRLLQMVNSIPQQLIWSALAIVGFVFALFLGRGMQQKSPEPIPPRPPSQTQLERLTRLIELAETSSWARDVLGRRLSETAAGLRALREGVHPDQVREEIRTGRWPAHLPVMAVLRPERERNRGHVKPYADQLDTALDAMECYVRGGTLEPD